MRARAARAVGALAVALGVAGLAHGAYIPVKAWLAQALLERSWQATVARGEPARAWPWADTWPVARLIVPSLAMERVVLAGASGEALAFAPALVAGSPAPGLPGTAVIAGHRDTHFRFLRQLTPGERIDVVGADARRHPFRITATEVVDASTTAVELDGPEPRLLLVTCYPFDAVAPGGPLRYVVVAEPLR